MTYQTASFFDDDVVDVARRLIGATLLVKGVGGIVVETEAYGAQDPASHSFRGPTARNGSMFKEPGTVYVYRSYGIHWCVNVVCQPGTAVLFRALLPTHGIPVMEQRRGMTAMHRLCAGPGCLTQALAIDARHDGLEIFAQPFDFAPPPTEVPSVCGPRIGISKAVDLPWRFCAADGLYLSKPLKKNGPALA